VQNTRKNHDRDDDDDDDKVGRRWGEGSRIRLK